jgi:hypothetical protein
MRNARAALAAAFFAASILSGCVAWTAVDAGTETSETSLSVTPDRKWNRLGAHLRVWSASWTINGPLLDALDIAVGVEDGKPLVAVRGDRAKMFATFRAGMSADDVVALVQSTLTQLENAKDFALVSAAPDTIAGHEGIRFEFTYGTGGQGGLETDRHALGVAFEAEKRLYVLLFHAAEVHYFPALRPAAEAVFRSARLNVKPRT